MRRGCDVRAVTCVAMADGLIDATMIDECLIDEGRDKSARQSAARACKMLTYPESHE